MKGKGDKKTFILQRDETINKKYRRSSLGAGNLNKNYQLMVKHSTLKNNLVQSSKNIQGGSVQIKSAFLEDDDDKEQEVVLAANQQQEFNQNRRDHSDVESMIEDESEESLSDSENPVNTDPATKLGSQGENRSRGAKDSKKSSSRENDMLKLRHVKVNVLQPFFDDNFKDFYLKQMVLKNLDKILMAAMSLLISITINLITNFIYQDSSTDMWTSRILEIVCILGLALFVALYNSDVMVQSPLITKGYLGVIIAVSMISRLIEIYYLHMNDVGEIK